MAFVWERTFHHALRSFRDAVLRRGHAIRLLYVHRVNTNLTEQVPRETREKYDILATITEAGETTLTPAFTNAITNAERAADARAQADANARAQRAGGMAGGQRPARRR